MHVHRLSRIATAALCACSLLLGPAAVSLAQTAQTAQTAQMAPEIAAAPADADPPGRVARLNYMAGTVTSEPAGGADWSYAQINRPLTTGDQLWNDENARSELHIGSTAVRLGSSTSLDILSLDDANAQLKVAQGTLLTHVRSLPPGNAYEIDTPNAALGITSPGDYRVDVAPDGSRTTVTVRSGSLTAYGDGGAAPMRAGQQITFAGTALQQVAASGVPAADGFDQWAADRDAAEDRSVSARYVSRDVPGYQDLDANGSWQNDPSYGEVWVPNAVPADWAPYRQGHWAWQAPWGWTWIDDAPWGFAPYHYGRWAYAGSRWAWVPGPLVESAPPAYAPALVAFVGDGGGGVDWNVGLAIGGAAAAAGVAWFPLGPGEPWRGHRNGWSPRYNERVNRNVYVDQSVHVRNAYVNYRAPGAVTAVPATAFVHGRSAGREAVRVDPGRWRHPRFIEGGPGIAPTRASFEPGLRRADYRPPQGAFGRPVVATRAPLAPPAFHDAYARRLAAGPGARVTGAGNPAVRVAPDVNGPPNPRGDAPHMPNGRENIHLVATHGPARSLEDAAIAARGGARQGNPGAAGTQTPRGGSQAGHAGDGRNGGVPRPSQTVQWGNGQMPSPPPSDANRQPGLVQHGPQWSGNDGQQPRNGSPQERPAGQPPRQNGAPAAANGPQQRDAAAVPHPPMPHADQRFPQPMPQAAPMRNEPRFASAQQPQVFRGAQQPQPQPPAHQQQAQNAHEPRQDFRPPQTEQTPRQPVHAPPPQQMPPSRPQARQEPRAQPQQHQAPPHQEQPHTAGGNGDPHHRG
ncbi:MULTISPECIES: DUF6600 domain-containing protein [unclassified Caballeronia]|uniref:DUF6600 domain-containing protein n=1 Tax=unclassified Caballeronia TaxID=2646786 RepID=UPI002861D51B|nr:MULTISPECIES: DUF6600 domain-containing protein [unclassified Caballeronia]MDR5751218.1 hypothetical protein [Caballeronia sp. LZ024]MDR5844645.1 hypothetical protein [Caballeronia sp. LZ031]